MENRIDRKDDESLYQPKIHSDRIRTLYNLKQETGKPMTVLLDQAIRDLEAGFGSHGPVEDGVLLENLDEETWEDVCEYRRVLGRVEYQKHLEELERQKTNQP